MKIRFSVLGVFALLTYVAAAAAGCGTSSPAQPSTTTTAATVADGAASTASIIAPRPLSPANNAQIRNSDQPVTLTVQNAISTKSGATYTFEVATDLAFSSKVLTKDGVAEGTGGATGVKLDQLTPGKDYYWHARATVGGTTGLFGAVSKFSVGPAIQINAPAPIAPLTGAHTFSRPSLRVTNAIRTGPAGAITYLFEISTSAAFTPLLVSGTNTEGVNETGFIPNADLPATGTVFWRATAVDAGNGATSAPSAVQSFIADQSSQAALVAAKLGVKLWPGLQPPGSPGHAVMGRDWNAEPLVSFDGVRFMNPPLDTLQIFDLIDRGLTPAAAVDWMRANGYATIGVWYPDVQVVAFAFEYMALINGQWDIVLRVGA